MSDNNKSSSDNSPRFFGTANPTKNAFGGSAETESSTHIAGITLNQIEKLGRNVGQMAAIRPTEINIKAREQMKSLHDRVADVIRKKPAPAPESKVSDDMSPDQNKTSPSLK